MSSFVYPFIASISLVSFQEDDWLEVANHVLMLLKRIEIENIHSSFTSSLEFLECLLCQFLLSRKQSLSFECPCEAIQNGFNEMELASLLTNQQVKKYCNEKEIQQIKLSCQFYIECIQGVSKRMKYFYSELENTCSIPSIIQRKYHKEIILFCRLYLTFHIHNLSLQSL